MAALFLRQFPTKNGEKEYDTKYNRTMIKEDYDLSSSQVNDVMKGVKDSIFEAEQRKINMVLPDYTDQDKQDFVDELKKVFPDEIIFYCAVSIADKIHYKILENIINKKVTNHLNQNLVYQLNS